MNLVPGAIIFNEFENIKQGVLNIFKYIISTGYFLQARSREN
ncbi:hypothetical protein [Rickettsia montanensis]|nr:hypothetical protein [Rickettsia montanensis]